MKTRAHVGTSHDLRSFEAGREAAELALRPFLGKQADLVLVFGTTGYDQAEMLRGVRSAAKSTRISGCSAEGVIAGGDAREDEHSVAVMAIRSGGMTFAPFLVRDYTADVPACAAKIAAHATGDDIVGIVLFPDGLTGDCSGLLEALAERLPHAMVVGGTSADAMELQRTYQYLDDTIASDAVSGMIIRGRGRMDVAVSHGCSPIGLERTITKADQGWIHEIDDRPAWDVFKEYLDGEPESLSVEGIPHLCIGLPLDGEASAEYAPLIIRTPMNLNPETGALFFPGGGLKQGARIHMTRRDPEKIKNSAVKCAQRIVADHDASPSLVFQFDCCGRGKILFGAETAEHTVHPLRSIVGESVPWLGFHTYGEIASLAGRPFFHNYTVALCALYDDLEAAAE